MCFTGPFPASAIDVTAVVCYCVIAQVSLTLLSDQFEKYSLTQ